MISGRFFAETFYDEIYKPVKKLGQINTVIDLGACTGEFSLYVYPQAEKIYAIEANKQAYGYLKENVKDFPKITPVFLAIAGKNGKREVWGEGIGGSTTVLSQGKGINGVKGQTLATFLKENNIEKVDCLKIDVESAEKEIFEAEDFPKVADKIKYIIGEHLEPSELVLKAHGFKFKAYEHGQIAKRI